MNISKTRRPDTSLGLIHLTGPRQENSAFDSLISILNEGHIRGSNNSGFIKGSKIAACFTEMPLSSIKYFVEQSKSTKHPYNYFGIAISKEKGWEKGLRPVIYLPDNESEWIPPDQSWRHVRYEFGIIDFSHEREWRAEGNFSLDGIGFYVIVPDISDEVKIREIMHPTAREHTLGFLHMNIINQFI